MLRDFAGRLRDTMSAILLILNAGSSTLKFAIHTRAAGNGTLIARGLVDAIGQDARLRLLTAPDAADAHDVAVAAADHAQALAQVLGWLDARCPALRLHAVGHRVVHGGSDYTAPVRVDARVLADLDALMPLSPLHQPHCLAGIRALSRLRSGLPQVACFDTAFHHTLPAHARRFALPRELEARGIRRYGFHGLSYEFIAGALPEYLGETADRRVVVAHLGNGASLCALQQRRSVETSMSFTPLDGIPMATRCGALDPGVVLHLLRAHGMRPDELDTLLHHRSGLLGVSGISGDVRVLQQHSDPRAAEALELFAYRTAQAVAAHAVALGGLDALVFTAGIGEHAASVRADIVRHLAWLGIALDDAANACHGPCISTSDSRVSAWVIPTDEEQIIARHTRALTAA